MTDFPFNTKFRQIIQTNIGAWRSLVAHLHGVQVVGGSNPLAPIRGEKQRFSPLPIRTRFMEWPIKFTCLCIVLVCLGCGSQIGKRPPRGEWVTVLSGDSVSKLADKYQIPMSDIIEINALSDPSRIVIGQSLFIPQLDRVIDPKAPIKKTSSEIESLSLKVEEQAGFRLLKGAPMEVMREIRWPITPQLSQRIGLSSPFGTRKGKPHKGIDLSAPMGTDVHASLEGEVIRSELSSGGYGWVIYLKHAGGVETRYAHHEENLVKKGRYVQAGEVIAKVGNSGRSSGPHLHFEIRVNGEAIDPLIVLPALSSTLSQSNLRPRRGLSLDAPWATQLTPNFALLF